MSVPATQPPTLLQEGNGIQDEVRIPGTSGLRLTVLRNEAGVATGVEVQQDPRTVAEGGVEPMRVRSVIQERCLEVEVEYVRERFIGGVVIEGLDGEGDREGEGEGS